MAAEIAIGGLEVAYGVSGIALLDIYGLLRNGHTESGDDLSSLQERLRSVVLTSCVQPWRRLCFQGRCFGNILWNIFDALMMLS